ncbi:hypothetical protein ACEPPN_007350 [Leptodophora sp. 'Broadleaf-Isolate-01']
MRRRALATSIFIFALSIISTTFVLLALTSKRWSVQKYYINDVNSPGLGATWTTPICVANKSPFYRCDAPVINTTAHPNTCVVPNCQFYRPYGRNKTSCRLAVETVGMDPDNGLIAGAQECQDVHYTGNLQIAASVFITLALILLLPITAANILLTTSSHHPAAGAAPTAESAATEPSTTKTHHPDHNSNSNPHHRPQYTHRFSPYTPPIVLFTILSLYIGVILQLIAQFFGVLGLTIIATPDQFQAVQHASGVLGATPWVIDKALATYATVAWTSALACAVLVSRAYRMPRWDKFF